MGYILLARGERRLFFWTEFLSSLVLIGFTWAGIKFFGLDGIGMAFFGSYVVYFTSIYCVVRRLCGFRWSTANRRLGLLFAPLIAAVFVSWYVLPRWAAITLDSLSAIWAGFYSLKTLCALLPEGKIPGIVRKLVALFRPAPPAGV